MVAGGKNLILSKKSGSNISLIKIPKVMILHQEVHQSYHYLTQSYPI